jgi:hypothetical protein
MRMSRLIIGTVLLVFIMLLGLGPAAFAASVTHDADDTSRLKDTLRLKNVTISWDHPLIGGTCAIPAAVGSINPVDKTGDRVRKVTRKELPDGSQVIVQDDLKTGTAKERQENQQEDSSGATYHFVYKNRAIFYMIFNKPPDPTATVSATVNVEMTDDFSLTGNGLDMNVSFDWSWKYEAPNGVDFPLEPFANFPVIPFVFATADGVEPDTDHSVTDWQQLSTQGDPFHCDPL